MKFDVTNDKCNVIDITYIVTDRMTINDIHYAMMSYIMSRM